MAELSEQTEAILERLKAEGQLTRNTGTNSLKSVKVDLGKFTDVLSSVNSNIAEQTSIMRQTLDYNVQEAQRARDEARQEQLSEVARKAEEKEKETQSKTEEGKKTRSSETTSIGGVLTNMLSGFKNFVVKSLLGAVGGIAIFELARGFFDERTNGGFSQFFDDIDWQKMTTDMTYIATTIADGAKNFVNFVADPMGAILSAIGPVGAGAAVVTAAGLGGLLNSTDGDSDGVTKRRSKLRNFVKLSALGLVLAGTSAAATSVGNWVDKQEWSDDEIGSTTKGDLVKAGVDIGQAAIIGGSIGMMFGPGGALVGAVLGATVTLGFKAYEWWNGQQKKNQARLDAELAAAEQLYTENADEFKKLLEDMSQMTREKREELYDSLSKEAQNAVDFALAQTEIYDRKAYINDLEEAYVNYLKGGAQTAPVAQQTKAEIEKQKRELEAYIMQYYGGGGLTGAPTTSYAEQVAAEERARTEANEARFDSLQPFRDADRIYRQRMSTLANEAMLERARQLGNAELMAGYINYGTRDQVGLSDYAQGFRREGGVTFKLKTSYGDVTAKEVEDGIGWFGKIGKMLGFGGEDVSAGSAGGNTIIYKDDRVEVNAPQVTGGNNLAIQSNIGGGTAPTGSEFPGYGN